MSPTSQVKPRGESLDFTDPKYSDNQQLQAYRTATVTLSVVLGVILLLLLLAARNKTTVKKMLGAWLAD